jgi:hypothetical protein
MARTSDQPPSLVEKVAALSVEMAETRRRTDEQRDILIKQLDALVSLREETRLAAQSLGAILANDSKRLNDIEDWMHEMERLHQRLWGIAVAGIIIAAALGAGFDQALRLLLDRFLGI